MTKASRVRATPPRGLPEDIVVWEILVRLPPKSLLRCRAVCHAWRRATSTRLFLQTHHERQPSLPIVSGSEHSGGHHKNILAFDHRATGAQLQPVARLNDSLFLRVTVEASCDGLLVLSKCGITRDRFSVCNPTTRQHAPLQQLSSDFSVLGMYAHRPAGEYRLLLHQTLADQICCYVFVLGSDQPPRYVSMLRPASNDSPRMFYVDTKGNLVHSFHRDGQHVYACQHRLKQTLVWHTFFTTLEDYGVNTSPFVG